MNRISLLLLTLVVVVPLFATGCNPDSGIRLLPNDLPVAIALFDNGSDNAAEQRLGYVIQGEVATLDASSSFDPDNASSATALDYRWSFAVLPEGSLLLAEDVVAPEDDPDTPDIDEGAWASFTPDVLGTYRLELVVVDDEDGESQPAVLVVVSSPASNLLIQLDWSDTQADLDLHLISPGGNYFGTGDCFSWEPNPNWGDSSLANDNPLLEYDDDGEGQAPYRESISFGAPADGDYEVWVHFYSDHSQTLGYSHISANPTLNITVLGEAIWDESIQTPSPSSPLVAGDIWKAGVLSWPARSWSPLDIISDHAAEGGANYNSGDGAGDGSN